MSEGGFRQSVDTGLFVPPDLSRKRQVWTNAERLLLERAQKLLNGRDVGWILRCMHPSCNDAPIRKVNREAGTVLRCNCTDRVLSHDKKV